MRDVVMFVAASFAVVFAASALGKVDGWEAWRDFVARFSESGSALVRRGQSYGVPGLEGLAIVPLLLKPNLGLYVAGALFLCFAVVPAVKYRSLRGEQCACFGVVHQSEIGVILIGRNLGLAVAAFAVGAASPAAVGSVPVLAVCTGALLLITLMVGTRLRADARTFIDLFEAHLLFGRKERA